MPWSIYTHDFSFFSSLFVRVKSLAYRETGVSRFTSKFSLNEMTGISFKTRLTLYVTVTSLPRQRRRIIFCEFSETSSLGERTRFFLKLLKTCSRDWRFVVLSKLYIKILSSVLRDKDFRNGSCAASVILDIAVLCNWCNIDLAILSFLRKCAGEFSLFLFSSTSVLKASKKFSLILLVN